MDVRKTESKTTVKSSEVRDNDKVLRRVGSTFSPCQKGQIYEGFVSLKSLSA